MAQIATPQDQSTMAGNRCKRLQNRPQRYRKAIAKRLRETSRNRYTPQNWRPDGGNGGKPTGSAARSTARGREISRPKLNSTIQGSSRSRFFENTGERDPLYRNSRRRYDNITMRLQPGSMEDSARRYIKWMRSRLNDRTFRLETGLSDNEAEDQFYEFEKSISKALEEDPRKPAFSSTRSALLEAYQKRQENGLQSQLKYLLSAKIANHKFQRSDIVNQAKLADLRYPAEWYPAARSMRRTIHLHIGPTNSGKTYHALKRLEEAETGCYASPLRLLAHEVYTRLNAKGKHCNLVTGDEIIVDGPVEAGLSSCTVEMVPLGRDLDVAVIDEIQMIADSQRGWAWTEALLGLRAKELHLCGETRTLPLIRQLAASLGEELVIHNYERLSPLQVANRGLGGRLDSLKKGDCVVSFSRKILHNLKQEIQNTTGKEVAIVYGALPPEIRAQQANLFNDQDNDYDILVASDAIGMGLNLSIKRVIFETLSKFDGTKIVPIAVPSIKQIGGRAGRYRTAAQANASAQITEVQANDLNALMKVIPPRPPSENIGYITTLHDSDLPRLRTAMGTEPPPILAAGLKVPDMLIIRFASYFPPETPFSYILLRLNEISQMHPRYFLCSLTEQVAVADAIQQVEGLTISERMMMCYGPVDAKNPVMRPILVAMARCVASRKRWSLLDIPEINLEILDEPSPQPSQSEKYVMEVAAAHQAVVLYLWLSYRMNNIFHSQALAFHTKALLQEKLDTALSTATLNKMWLQRRFQKIQAARKKQEQQEQGHQNVVVNGNSDVNENQNVDQTPNVDPTETPFQGLTPAAIDDEGDPKLMAELKDEFSKDRTETVTEMENASSGRSRNALDFIPPQSSSSSLQRGEVAGGQGMKTS